MLVLTRKSGEELIIGDGIVVSVLGVHGGRVQIGVEAPKSVRIRRLEVCSQPEQPLSDPELCVATVRAE